MAEKQNFFVDRPYAIHAANCMLVLQNGLMVPAKFDPDFRSRNQLAVAYEPAATCLEFEKELLVPALQQGGDLITIKKMFGLCVLGRNRPQRIFILIGAGNTGKTTVGLIIERLIGRQNCAELRTKQLEGRFEMARLVNKTLVFGPDVAADFLMSETAHRLKSIVGRDPLVAERKNSSDDFRFLGDLNALITANEDLLIRLHGEYDRSAWRRRLCVILFAREPITKRITNYDEVLLAKEGSGILNLAIKGLVSYFQDEATCGDIALSKEAAARIDNLLNKSEALRIFITEEFVATEKSAITSDQLVVAFAAYAKDKGWRLVPRRTIEEQARHLMLEIWGISQSHDLKQEGQTVRGYRGIRLRKADETDL
jgi:P4 family phage/plasmid primase-like protien